MLKKILVNLLLTIILLGTIELYCFNKAKTENLVMKQKADRLESNNTRDYVTKYTILSDFKANPVRNSFFSKDSYKKPILWFGCSFAEGAGLDDNRTPCYKVSKLTNRNCINRSKGATGTQFMYYQLKNEDFFTQNPEADYIIYIFIHNHLQRLYNYQINPLINMFNLRYELKNGKLKEIYPLFKPFYSSFAIKRFLNKKVNRQTEREKTEFTLFNAIIKESKAITDEKYPNSKFIIMEFPDLSGEELPIYEIEELESMGIKVVRVTDIFKKVSNLSDIYNSKYWLIDNIHPSEALWDVILPPIIQNYID